ncbi:hypothetical protein [Microbacterium sp. No. 7]|uniref:hypothetical protein n=1 Tax=Microbacterium sp. No. 7 TaxID=1714373 RepID=UPI0012E19CB5|nr:hypothetical protein [Microbacterium sp. No. 7]
MGAATGSRHVPTMRRTVPLPFIAAGPAWGRGESDEPGSPPHPVRARLRIVDLRRHAPVHDPDSPWGAEISLRDAAGALFPFEEGTTVTLHDVRGPALSWRADGVPLFGGEYVGEGGERTFEAFGGEETLLVSLAAALPLTVGATITVPGYGRFVAPAVVRRP